MGESGGRTPVTHAHFANSMDSDDDDDTKDDTTKKVQPTPTNGNAFPHIANGNMTSFPSIRTPTPGDDWEIPDGVRGIIPTIKLKSRRGAFHVIHRIKRVSQKSFGALPTPVQNGLAKVYSVLGNFLAGLWEFMNPPLWAMLLAIIVASIPNLQRLFFEDGSFIANSVTRAIGQSGGVAVPLILVVLGANLARNTLPKESLDPDSEENQIGTKLMIASLISRMLPQPLSWRLSLLSPRNTSQSASWTIQFSLSSASCSPVHQVLCNWHRFARSTVSTRA